MTKCRTSETSQSSPTSTTARRLWLTKSSNSPNCSAKTRKCTNVFWTTTILNANAGSPSSPRISSVNYKGVKINIIDTPGHSDFGGQVERVLNMADGVILLVDSAEGPLPQTRFVLDKALKLKLKPIVVINKIDRPDARPNEVHNAIFDLFIDLDATEEQLDFPLLYASGRNGWATTDLEHGKRDSILPLMDAIIEQIPPPPYNEGPLQMQITTLDYNDYVGRIGIGRVHRGTLEANKPIAVVKRDGTVVPASLKQIFTFEGIGRRQVDKVECGDLCAVVGIEGIDISDTVTDANAPKDCRRSPSTSPPSP